MKKYLNRGLLYEWFNAAKVPIIMGLITWGYYANRTLKWGVMDIKSQLGRAEMNGFSTVDLWEYTILAYIFLAIYFFASGVSKRNTTMFLCSGPYTKKQIKINELICLLITLGFFVMMYLYIAVTTYVRNYELMLIVNGYFGAILIEVIRILLIGTIGIILMLIIDLLFSNSIMTFLGSLALFIASIGILGKTVEILNYFGVYTRIMNTIFGGITGYNRHRSNILFFEGRYSSEEFSLILKGIILLSVIIGIMFLILNIEEKRSKLETSNKIFSSKENESIIIKYISLGIGAFLNIILIETFLRDSVYIIRRNAELLSSDITRMLTIDAISISIITFLLYKILKKVLKMVG